MVDKKISELPPYDQATASDEDFIAAVQGGVTKRIDKGSIIKRISIREGHLSPTPKASQFVAIIGTPENESIYAIRDTTGGGGIYIVIYTGNAWMYEKLTEAI